MALINVNDGAAARAIHVRQILSWLRGDTTYVEPVTLTGLNSTSYSLTLRNREASGNALNVLNDGGTISLFKVANVGVVVKGSASDKTYFRVRNFADTQDVFAVTESGASINGVDFVTLTATQTLTNKTLTAPVLNGAVINDYADINQPVSAPANPGASKLRVYGLSSDSILRHRNSAGTVVEIIDDTSAQTLTNKTLTQPTVTTPTVSGYIGLVSQASDPVAPSAGSLKLYGLTSNDKLYFRNSSGIRSVATQEGTETLTNKTLTSPLVSDYIKFAQTTAPTGAAGNAWIYSKSATPGLLFYKANSDTERTIVDTDSTQTLSNKSFGSGLALAQPVLTGPVIANYQDTAHIASPGAPASGYTRIYAKNDNNMYFHPQGGSETLLLTNANSASVAASGFARGLSLGSL